MLPKGSDNYGDTQGSFLAFVSRFRLNSKQALNVPARFAHTMDFWFMFSGNSLPHFIFGTLFAFLAL